MRAVEYPSRRTFPQEPARRGVARSGDGAAIMPTEIGTLFRDLRRALALSMPQLARILKTRIGVLQALEMGDIERLPPWPETARVITAFTELGRIDPSPVLRILGAHMAANATPAQTSSPFHQDAVHKLKTLAQSANLGPGATRARQYSAAILQTVANKTATVAARTIRKRALPLYLPRKGLILLIAATCILGALYQIDGSRLSSHLADLSPPLSRMLHRAQGYFRNQDESVKDGLRWIEVDDPRSRRGDRLDGGRS
jgi:Helix-turn-helix domain